ncbi:MAG: hypothetical protein JRI95_00550 [Deltaproteobacteria bacterium]|nr:hypothetical protein [Deltaproteobacteria bacterium]MBW2085312.1 hypothetical protein [Deltaproteobacteria bacterium]
MHHTNKAFERYFQIDMDDERAIYSCTDSAPGSEANNGDKVVDIKGKIGAEGGI